MRTANDVNAETYLNEPEAAYAGGYSMDSE